MSTLVSQRTPKILCLDDDPAIAAAIDGRLRPYDVEVHSAFFGTQGIWLAVTERPDVIVTDLRMPNGDGDYVVDCLRQRADTRGIPIIVLTGCRTSGLRRAMSDLGVKHFLYKPADFDALLAALGDYVELRKRAASAEPAQT